MPNDSENPATELTELQSWFDASGAVKGDFARRCGISAAFLSQLLKGVRSAGYEKAKEISTATGGVVSIESLTYKDGVGARRKLAEASAKKREARTPAGSA